MANEQLKNAKSVKNDEFYTRMEDINAELVHYEKYFQDKVVFMNCDDPTWSNFWRYFHIEFERLGLKKIISTHYESGEVASYAMIYEGGNDEDFEVGIRKELTQNGDFRSPECIELLKEADIVVTNPPFSLFREYVAQLIEYDKKFIIMGNKNAITYKEFFPLLKDNKVWVGATSLNGGRWMIMPKDVHIASDKAKKDSDGNMILNVAGVCWFTNLVNKKRTEMLETSYLYAKKDELYPDLYLKYDNYDAINVDKVTEIPMDYCESWGVTDEIFAKLNPCEWERVRVQRFDDDVVLNFVVPAKDTELREILSKHEDGYREVIEAALTDSIYCSGHMGVPITFLDKYDPEQFVIVGADFELADKVEFDDGTKGTGRFYTSNSTTNMTNSKQASKRLYSRIVIRRQM